MLTRNLRQRLTGLRVDVVRSEIGKGHCHVRVFQNIRIGDVTRHQVQHLVVEERDIQIDGPRRVPIRSA